MKRIGFFIKVFCSIILLVECSAIFSSKQLPFKNKPPQQSIWANLGYATLRLAPVLPTWMVLNYVNKRPDGWNKNILQFATIGAGIGLGSLTYNIGTVGLKNFINNQIAETFGVVLNSQTVQDAFKKIGIDLFSQGSVLSNLTHVVKKGAEGAFGSQDVQENLGKSISFGLWDFFKKPFSSVGGAVTKAARSPKADKRWGDLLSNYAA